jgi:hypothetical protein
VCQRVLLNCELNEREEEIRVIRHALYSDTDDDDDDAFLCVCEFAPAVCTVRALRNGKTKLSLRTFRRDIVFAEGAVVVNTSRFVASHSTLMELYPKMCVS